MSDDAKADRISTWHGEPIESMSRGQLIDALDWAVKRIREDQVTVWNDAVEASAKLVEQRAQAREVRKLKKPT